MFIFTQNAEEIDAKNPKTKLIVIQAKTTAFLVQDVVMIVTSRNGYMIAVYLKSVISDR